jgi:hypothetical protein
MRRLLAVTLSALALACDGRAETGEQRLRLVLPAAAIPLTSGESQFIQLLVLGQGAEPVVFSAELPAFASLQGELLWLSPGRADAGHHVLRIAATAGSQRAEATFAVDVTRDNTGPTWCAAPTYWLADDAGEYTPMVGWGTQICPGEACVLGSGPRLIVFPTDAEQDEIEVDVEVVPLGQPFTGTPTLSARQRPGDLPLTDTPRCAYFDLPLPGLTPGTDYAFRLRMVDEWGALWFDAPGYSGWHPYESRFRFEPAAP